MDANNLKKLIDDNASLSVDITTESFNYYFNFIIPHLYQDSNSYVKYGYEIDNEQIIIDSIEISTDSIDNFYEEIRKLPSIIEYDDKRNSTIIDSIMDENITSISRIIGYGILCSFGCVHKIIIIDVNGIKITITNVSGDTIRKIYKFLGIITPNHFLNNYQSILDSLNNSIGDYYCLSSIGYDEFSLEQDKEIYKISSITSTTNKEEFIDLICKYYKSKQFRSVPVSEWVLHDCFFSETNDHLQYLDEIKISVDNLNVTNKYQKLPRIDNVNEELFIHKSTKCIGKKPECLFKECFSYPYLGKTKDDITEYGILPEWYIYKLFSLMQESISNETFLEIYDSEGNIIDETSIEQMWNEVKTYYDFDFKVEKFRK